MIDPLLAALGLTALIAWIVSMLRPDACAVTVDGIEIPLPEDDPSPSWRDYVHFKKDAAPAPAPDPRIGQAAVKNAQLGEDWLKFAREQFKDGNLRQEEMDELTRDVIEQQMDTQDRANQWAEEDRERYKEVFQPLEDEFIEAAKTYDSQEKQAQAAAEAATDVQQAAATQRGVSERNMASMGIDPRSGRFAGQTRADDLSTALATAGAKNNARQIVRDKGLALKADAANMGRGLPAQAASAAGLGLNAGNSAAGNSAQANANWRGNVGIMGQGFGGAMQGYANQGNILNNLYGNQVNAWAAQQQANATSAAGIGSLVGTGIGAFAALSSKDYKEDKEPVDGALDAVKSMPVESWKYKDGIADGGRHVGPYAEDFHAATGKGDGKSIPLQDAIGVTMAAVQELDKKVDKIAAKRGGKRRAA